MRREKPMAIGLCILLIGLLLLTGGPAEAAENGKNNAESRPTLPPMTLVINENGVFSEDEPRPTLPPVTLVIDENVVSREDEPRPTLPPMTLVGGEEIEDYTVSAKEPSSITISIYGPEKMRADSKKFFKARYAPKNPKKVTLTWSLDCEPDVARVYRNGQVWVRPKATPGSIITLTCHAEGKDFNGEPWTDETSMQIEITPRK